MESLLKYHRKKKKLTQSRLSELTGISQSYISRMENKKFKHSPTLTQIILLSDVLEIDQLILSEFFLEKEREHLKNTKKYNKKAVKTLSRDFLKKYKNKD
ncbi:DNA-binding transcriptional repressor PuuR [Clostridioides difficile]|uniref:helix-turn-helix domain-containing protein n=1 Tax=Clostridioides difficile TaxID=1496 RepID=UPI0010B6B73F|nr:helix-turn-helix transcriptional regulator [Clostridioides difficile]VHX61453.1 DNA-binding transcriptional repressor PuuR [Clostridioides difficile]HBE8430550.1 helix-turn-helix transcriptional regulator [Clostridioides difficile]HBF6678856.1 helix-turn-helix transcriptional regulator [Clostridioides difficile]HBF9903898.1 helix-turn-helix transcriptional regulator [Clostridioides difficile]HBG4725744.1 helix-turn-helix transcriptional regulator [Clostridioides difficile]